jgi:hypothetical protein
LRSARRKRSACTGERQCYDGGDTAWGQQAMSGELAGLGEIATGALLGRATEPRHGEVSGGASQTADQRCLNCGTTLTGQHCHQCGQAAHVHRTVGAFGHDLLHGVLHFDGKLWRTLPLLVWRPGDLTRRYIEGERAQFVSPLALFLFTIFLTFAVFSSVGVGGTGELAKQIERSTQRHQAQLSMVAEIAETRAAIAAARAARTSTAALETRLTEQQAAARTFGLTDSGQAERNEFVVTDLETGNATIDAAIRRANDNPTLLIYKMQSYAYKYAWALIPLSAPILWLLYPFSRRYGWYDHLVFITYSLCFMLLLLMLLRLLAAAGLSGGIVAVASMVIPPMHIYRQLRGAYRARWWSALLRTSVLVFAAFFILIFAALALMLLGAMD